MLYPIPEDAKAYIIAELEENQSDLYTDYFGSKTVKKVLLGFSKHNRNLFSEMRKIADTYGPTQHLGVNKGEFRIYDNWMEEGSNYPQSEVFRADDSPAYFETEAEAKAFAEKYAQEDRDSRAKLQADEKGFCPNFRGEYSIDGSTGAIENRQNYSMGGGYFLGHHRYSGWKIRKVDLSFPCSRTEANELIQSGHHNLGASPTPTKARKQPAQQKKVEAPHSGITVTENEEKDGVEIRFPGKPSEDVRSQLKENGFRWSRFSTAWYAKRNSKTLAFAYGIVTTAVQEQPEEPVIHVQAELLALPAASPVEEQTVLDDPNASVNTYREAVNDGKVISLLGFSQAIHRENRGEATQPPAIEPETTEPEAPAYLVVSDYIPDLGLTTIQTPQQELAAKIEQLNIAELPAEKITALLQVIG